MSYGKRSEHDELGASAVEYGLLIAGIAAFIVVVIFAFNDTITGLFGDTCDSIGSASGNRSTC